MGQLVAVFGLALLDSLNPSALLVTLYLLTQPRAGVRVVTYLSAIFVTYLGVGVALMLGLGALLRGVGGALESPLAYALQGGVGGAMLLYSLLAPAEPKRAPSVPPPQGRALWGTFLLGVTVTVLEFPTAFPYLGAIGILTSADLSPSQWLSVLLVYNLIFILLPTLLLVAHRVLGGRLEARFERWRERLQKEARETMLWIVGIVGFFLLTDALGYFGLFDLLVDVTVDFVARPFNLTGPGDHLPVWMCGVAAEHN